MYIIDIFICFISFKIVFPKQVEKRLQHLTSMIKHGTNAMDD